jgi:hypothetical protein
MCTVPYFFHLLACGSGRGSVWEGRRLRRTVNKPLQTPDVNQFNGSHKGRVCNDNAL